MKRNVVMFSVAAVMVIGGLIGLAVAQHEPGQGAPPPRVLDTNPPAHAPMGQPPHAGMMGQPPQGPGPAQFAMFAEVIGRLSDMAGNSQAVGVLAVGGLKDDIRRKPADIIKDLEGLLGQVKAQAIRNALRLSLKDLYKAQGEDDKALEQLRNLVLENDKALTEKK